MDVIAGADFNLPPRTELTGIRVGVPKNFFFERVDPEVMRAIQNAVSEMQRRNATLIDVRVPDLNDANTAAKIVQYSEVAALYVQYNNPVLFGSDVWDLIQQGKRIAGHEYVNAQRIRTLFRRDFDALWKNIDVLVAPTTPVTAPVIDTASIRIGDEEENTRMATTRLVRAINFLGEPALSIPCGKDRSGMPVGLQLIGPPFSEPELLQIGNAVETFLSA
jgi:aspartyl-tRNA(Asn)/glutamyl-tRNA(Gln) amidotransferase subunit A